MELADDVVGLLAPALVHGEPLVEGVARVEDVRHDVVQERPQLVQVVLD